jgi:FkbM family methyltransferase
MPKSPSVFKKIYASAFAHPALMQPLRALNVLPEAVYRHLFVKGKLKIKTPDAGHFFIYSDGFYVETLLFWGGLAKGWEKESLKIWYHLAKKSRYIVDVGANTGIYSLVAGAANPSAKIYAFEPIERVFHRLNRNVTLNNFQIELFQMACGAINGQAVIYDSPLEHNYEASLVKNPHSKNATFVETTINIQSLDHLLDTGKLDGIDLIKIDVEKFEPEVLAGFKKLRTYMPDMLIEILDEEVAAAIETQISDLPYLYFNINERNGPQRVAHLKPSDTYNYLICKEASAASLGLI